MNTVALYPGIKTLYDTIGWQQSVNRHHLETCYGPVSLGTLSLEKVYGFTCSDKADKWLYPIPVSFSSTPEKCTVSKEYYIRIPDEVVKKVLENKCIILFDYSSEGLDSRGMVSDPDIMSFMDRAGICDYTFQIIKNTIQYYNLSRDQSIFLSANIHYRDTDHDFRTCFLNLFEVVGNYEIMRSYAQTEKNLILNRTIRQNKLTCLSYRSKPTRMWTAYEIYRMGLKEDNLVTMGQEQKFALPEHIAADKEFLSTMPWLMPGHQGIPSHNDAWVDAHKNSYVIYSHESFDDVDVWKNLGNTFVVTEKTILNTLIMKPFIIQGGEKGTLAYLKTLGYETFSDWWDERYDFLHGMDKVHESFQNFVDLNKKSHTELADMLYEMYPVLEHNRNQFLNNFETGFHARYLKKLVEKIL